MYVVGRPYLLQQRFKRLCILCGDNPQDPKNLPWGSSTAASTSLHTRRLYSGTHKGQRQSLGISRVSLVYPYYGKLKISIYSLIEASHKHNLEEMRSYAKEESVKEYLRRQDERRSVFKCCKHGSTPKECWICQRILCIWTLLKLGLCRDIIRYITLFIRVGRKRPKICSMCLSASARNIFCFTKDKDVVITTLLQRKFFFEDKNVPRNYFMSFHTFVEKYGRSGDRRLFLFCVDKGCLTYLTVYKPHTNYRLFVCDGCIDRMKENREVGAAPDICHRKDTRKLIF